MNRIVITSIVSTAAAAALAVGVCAPAFADTPTPTPTPTPTSKAPQTLAAIQAKAKTATSDRETKLTAAIAKVTAAKGLTSSDRSTLLGRLNDDLVGMKSTEAKIAADTTASSAAADLKTVFTTYRVYAVALPQARVVSAVDRAESTGFARLASVESKLAADLSGKDAAKSTAALQADLADMKTQTAAAQSALSGVSAKAMSITPADYNANHDVVSSIRSSVKTALADLKKARADRKAIVSALK